MAERVGRCCERGPQDRTCPVASGRGQSPLLPGLNTELRKAARTLFLSSPGSGCEGSEVMEWRPQAGGGAVLGAGARGAPGAGGVWLLVLGSCRAGASSCRHSPRLLEWGTLPGLHPTHTFKSSPRKARGRVPPTPRKGRDCFIASVVPLAFALSASPARASVTGAKGLGAIPAPPSACVTAGGLRSPAVDTLLRRNSLKENPTRGAWGGAAG